MVERRDRARERASDFDKEPRMRPAGYKYLRVQLEVSVACGVPI